MKRIVFPIIILAISFYSENCLAQSTDNDTNKIKLKSENTAVLYSLLCTTGPLLVGLATSEYGAGGSIAFLGLLGGPSAGYFYAGKHGRAFTGIGIRLGATALMMGGVAIAFDGRIFQHDPKNDALAGAMIFGGAGILLADALVDIASAGRAAREHNKKLMDNKISVVPVYDCRSRTTGIQLSLRF